MSARSFASLLDGALSDDCSTPRLAGIENGDLLRLAEKEFDVFLTVDRKLSTQQDLTKFDIAIVLIRARSNRLEDIRPLVPELLETLSRATRRALMTVGEI